MGGGGGGLQANTAFYGKAPRSQNKKSIKLKIFVFFVTHIQSDTLMINIFRKKMKAKKRLYPELTKQKLHEKFGNAKFTLDSDLVKDTTKIRKQKSTVK